MYQDTKSLPNRRQIFLVSWKNAENALQTTKRITNWVGAQWCPTPQEVTWKQRPKNYPSPFQILVQDLINANNPSFPPTSPIEQPLPPTTSLMEDHTWTRGSKPMLTINDRHSGQTRNSKAKSLPWSNISRNNLTSECNDRWVLWLTFPFTRSWESVTNNRYTPKGFIGKHPIANRVRQRANQYHLLCQQANWASQRACQKANWANQRCQWANGTITKHPIANRACRWANQTCHFCRQANWASGRHGKRQIENINIADGQIELVKRHAKWQIEQAEKQTEHDDRQIKYTDKHTSAYVEWQARQAHSDFQSFVNEQVDEQPSTSAIGWTIWSKLSKTSSMYLATHWQPPNLASNSQKQQHHTIWPSCWNTTTIWTKRWKPTRTLPLTMGQNSGIPNSCAKSLDSILYGHEWQPSSSKEANGC